MNIQASSRRKRNSSESHTWEDRGWQHHRYGGTFLRYQSSKDEEKVASHDVYEAGITKNRESDRMGVGWLE